MPIQRAKRTVRDLFELLHRTPFWSEVWSGSGAVFWGLISYFGSGDVTQRPSFTPLGELAPTWVWELSGVVLGLLQLVFVARNHWPMRWVMAALLAAWWMLLMLCIMQYDLSAPTWGVYLSLVASNLVSMARVVRRH